MRSTSNRNGTGEELKKAEARGFQQKLSRTQLKPSMAVRFIS